MSAITLHHGDCLEVMARLTADGVRVHAVITDPPYHLTSIVRRFGSKNAAAAKKGQADHHTGAFQRHSQRFHGQTWDDETDGTGIAFRPETWAAVLDVLHPGGHLIAFNHARKFHRMTSAIEDAGFEIREMLAWIYGTGQALSHDQAKHAGPDWAGWGTTVRPSIEPIALARKPLAKDSIGRQCRATGTGALNIAATKLPGDRWPANVIHDGSAEATAGMPCDWGSGDAAQSYFYSAKANKADRRGSKHPTVKPQSLMRWLVRLVTAEGQTVLDPFAGSGATGWAAAAERRDVILIEKETEHSEHMRRLIGLEDARPQAPDTDQPRLL